LASDPKRNPLQRTYKVIKVISRTLINDGEGKSGGITGNYKYETTKRW